jgi:hypothetical protein
MPIPTRICRQCGREFTLSPTKPGNINDCANCAVDVPLLMAKVAYPSKNSSLVEIEITADRKAALAFNGAQKRRGAGPLSSIVAARESTVGQESGKAKTGAELGAAYTSRLGEKRTVKR